MKKVQSKNVLNFYLKKILDSRVYDVAKETSLDFADNLSEKLNNKIFLKREDTQPTFSFKIRGAYNKIANLKSGELKKGIIAASAGNHAQGVSLAANKLGIRSTIVMPKTTPRVKVEAVLKLGSKIIITGDSYSDAYEHAFRISKKEKLNLIIIGPNQLFFHFFILLGFWSPLTSRIREGRIAVSGLCLPGKAIAFPD